MKKIITILLIFSFLFSLNLVFAEGPKDATGPYHDEVVASGGLQLERLGIEPTEFEMGSGRKIALSYSNQKGYALRSGNQSAECPYCNLSQEMYQNRTRLYAHLSNGIKSEIKIMPEAASENALARLRVKACNSENNCSLELKEVGMGNQARLAYQVNMQKESRFLGLFRTRMRVEANIDAETGEIISSGKPWWAFLATE